MPYIKQEDRDKIHNIQDDVLSNIAASIRDTSDLGYALAAVAYQYLHIAKEFSHYDSSKILHPSVLKKIDELKSVVSYRTVPFLQTTITNFLREFHPASVGEVNYVMTYIIHTYLNMVSVSYTNLNNVIGTLERLKLDFTSILVNLKGHADQLQMFDAFLGIVVCVQMELYHMIARPYENTKILQNGPVSSLDAPHGVDLKKYKRPCQVF